MDNRVVTQEMVNQYMKDESNKLLENNPNKDILKRLYAENEAEKRHLEKEYNRIYEKQKAAKCLLSIEEEFNSLYNKQKLTQNNRKKKLKKRMNYYLIKCILINWINT